MNKIRRQNFCSACLNVNTFCLYFVGTGLVGKMIKGLRRKVIFGVEHGPALWIENTQPRSQHL